MGTSGLVSVAAALVGQWRKSREPLPEPTFFEIHCALNGKNHLLEEGEVNVSTRPASQGGQVQRRPPYSPYEDAFAPQALQAAD